MLDDYDFYKNPTKASFFYSADKGVEEGDIPLEAEIKEHLARGNAAEFCVFDTKIINAAMFHGIELLRRGFFIKTTQFYVSFLSTDYKIFVSYSRSGGLEPIEIHFSLANPPGYSARCQTHYPVCAPAIIFDRDLPAPPEHLRKISPFLFFREDNPTKISRAEEILQIERTFWYFTHCPEKFFNKEYLLFYYNHLKTAENTQEGLILLRSMVAKKISFDEYNTLYYQMMQEYFQDVSWAEYKAGRQLWPALYRSQNYDFETV